MTHLRLSHLLLATLALNVACDGGETTDTDAETDTEDTTTCTSSIDEFFPADGATGVFFRTPIEIYFNQDETSTATITLADASGADVPGTVTFSDDGEVASFAPSAALSPSTEYTLTAAYSCDKTATATFSTSATGAAVDPTTLIDNVYNIDLGSGRIINPPGVGDLVEPLIADAGVYILVSPTAIEGSSITMTGALGVDNGSGLEQDVCTESINFPVAADYTGNPYFTISGDNVAISVQGFDLEIAALDLSGAFSPDGNSIEGIKLDAFADTSSLGSLLDLGDDPAAVCGLLVGFGVSCVDCGNGQSTCIQLVVDSLTAPITTIDGLVNITNGDVQSNPACAAP
jgi:hypothetical protein